MGRARVTTKGHRGRPRGRKLNKRQKMQVKRIVGADIETKYSYSVTSPTAVSNTVFVGLLHSIPQGVTDVDRVGDRLKWGYKGHFKAQVAAGDSYNTVRLIIFQWKPNTPIVSAATTPLASSILLVGPSGSIDTLSLYNHDQRQLYHILYDKNHTMVGNAALGTITLNTPTSNSVINFRGSYKPKNHQVQYVGGSTTVGTNLIFYLYVSDSSINPAPVYAAAYKMLYTDS